MRDILLPWKWKRLLSAAVDAKLKRLLSAAVDAKLASMAPTMSDFTTKVDERLSELHEELYTIRHTLSKQLDAGSRHNLRLAAWDVQRGLAAVKNELAAQVGFSLHDIAVQTAEQRLWLERINDELAGLRTQLDEFYNLPREVSSTASISHDQSRHPDRGTIRKARCQ